MTTPREALPRLLRFLTLLAVMSALFGLYHSLTASIPTATMYFAQSAAAAGLVNVLRSPP
mgnify:CR=1 FL=1